jgi:hypothetical protein
MKARLWAESHIPGGSKEGDKHDREKFDPKELMMGIEVELEHTQDVDVAEEIAIDHLAENPRYYSELKAAKIKT